jgi:hypothetical protein
MQDFPDPAALDALREARVRWVVVQHAWISPPRRRSLERTTALRRVFEGRDADVYVLR